jgi:2-amino-4-hydroxy-6-hydroxymethyldihydropteridine diphosphokinase
LNKKNKSNSSDDAVIIALGSNLRGGMASIESLLEAALQALDAAGLRIVARSCWWRSAAWPDPSQPDYRNGVAIVETTLAPREALNKLLRIEAAFGRRRGEPNAARTLDLDLVAFGRRVTEEPGLTLPHPRAAERRFVMGPLAEIAPDWRHPVLKKTAAALAGAAAVGRDATPTRSECDGSPSGA